MSYFIKYQLSFVSDRNNIYDLHILQKNYGGQPILKKLGTAPMLSIEEGEGRVKGSSLSFSIQADVEGELKGLYTTNNKEFKVLLYRNSSLYWQGFLLPELYSENYIDPPYDVAVTATDQLGVLKNIQYNQERGNKSLLEIITYILTLTQLDLKIVQHLNLTISGNERFLSGAYVSTEGYYGQSCYDVLNSILLSCNTCIQQYENEWVIMSLTDATTAFVKDGAVVNISHVQLGQMGNAQVYPDGSLEMVNKPALKGVSLNYAHILKNSFLKNADCESKDGWQYSFESTDNRFPGTVDEFGVLYKCNCWQLPQKDVAVNGALQLWQDVNIKADNTYNCQMSVNYRMDLGASLLLMAIIHEGADGVTRRLTSEGWKEGGSATDKNSYINVTGTPSELWLTWAKDISDFSKYEKATVQFQLPAVDGVLRIGFINTTDTGYVNPLSGHIYLTKVYLTYMGIAGKASTTVVEGDATNAQEEISLAYGERVPATNEALAVLNTLRSSNGIPMEQFSLNSTSGIKSYDSYFLAMLQEMSRYYAVKKMQLQGSVMGGSPLHLLYADVFSGKIMRLVSGEYDLLQDSVGILLEEVPDAWVDYETEVFATDNSVPGTSSSGVVTVGGGSGASLLAVNAKGEVYVKDDRVLSGVEADFSRVVLPDKKPAGSADKAYIYSQAPKIGEILDANAVNMQLVIDELVGLRDDFDALSDLLNDDVAGVINTWDEVVDFLNEYSESQDLASILSRMDADIDAVEKRVTTLEDLGLVRVKEGDSYYIKSIYSFVSEGEIISGRRASGSGSGGGGGISEITAQMVVGALGYVPYSSFNPAGYITSAALDGYAKTSDIPSLSGYATETWVRDNYQPKGNYLTSVAWDIVSGKPTTLGGYGITDALSTRGGTITRNDRSLLLLKNTNAEGQSTLWLGGDFETFDKGGFIAYSGKAGDVSIVNFKAYANNNKRLSAIRITSDNKVQVGDVNFTEGQVYDVIHSGNIGSQNVNYANSANSANYSYGLGIENAANVSSELQYMQFSSQNEAGDLPTNNWWHVIKMGHGNADTYFNRTLAFSFWNNSILTRNRQDGIASDWEELAFLSSNVASATKLQTGRYLWGNYFNGESGVSGNPEYNYGGHLFFYNSAGSLQSAVYADNTLYLGMGYTNSSTIVMGGAVHLRYGGGTDGLVVNNQGNVLIGTPSDDGAKLQVNGYASMGFAVFRGVAKDRDYCYVGTPSSNNDMYLVHYYDNNIRFFTASVERMSITGGGNVVIGGTADNGCKFQVNGAAPSYFYNSSSRYSLVVDSGLAGKLITFGGWEHGEKAQVGYADNIGFGIFNYQSYRNNNAGEKITGVGITDTGIFYVANSGNPGPDAATLKVETSLVTVIGNLIATGELISSRRATSSDARLKDNINRLIAENCLAMVRNLQPSSWDWKENGEHSMGFIAQDIEPLMPYAVTRIKDDVLGQRLNLQYDQFFAPVVGAIQCLDIKIEDHETRLKRLETENTELKNRLSKYETVWQ